MITLTEERGKRAVAIVEALSDQATLRGDFDAVGGLAIVKSSLQLMWHELEALRPPAAPSSPPIPSPSPVAGDEPPDTSDPADAVLALPPPTEPTT